MKVLALAGEVKDRLRLSTISPFSGTIEEMT